MNVWCKTSGGWRFFLFLREVRVGKSGEFRGVGVDDLFPFSIALGGLAISFLIYIFYPMIMLWTFRFHSGGEELRILMVGKDAGLW